MSNSRINTKSSFPLGEERLDSVTDSLEQYLNKGYCAEALIESWNDNREGKRIIGEYIAKNLIEEDTIILDAGSTSIEILKAMVVHTPNTERLHVITNNLAASLLMTSIEMECTLLGGAIDTSHFCTLPNLDWEIISHQKPFQAIITAAAINWFNEGISIRARKPDQFAFKQDLLKNASVKIIVFDNTKWLAPFDGQYEFLVNEPGIHLVVDRYPTIGSPSLADACHTLGFQLHIASDATPN